MHRTSASTRVCRVVSQEPSPEPWSLTSQPAVWQGLLPGPLFVPVEVPSSHPLGCSGKEANEEKSSHPCLDSFGESSCQKAERPNSAKATGTGLRAGPGALVTSATAGANGRRTGDGFWFKVTGFRQGAS